MALTTPDNIWTPDAGEQYALTTDLATMADTIQDALNQSGLPAGDIIWSAATSRPGSLLANGTAVSRQTYSRLFDAIGTTYGAGDGSSTFNLPDIQGRVLVGRDPSDSSFNTLGEKGGSKTDSHSHNLNSSTVAQIEITSGGNVLGNMRSTSSYSGNARANASSDSPLGGRTQAAQVVGSTNNGTVDVLQPYMALNAFIVF